MLAALSVGPVRGDRVQKVSEGSIRRAKQLSVIFSQYITSMMNSGEVCPELVDLNFEIQRVSFKYLHLKCICFILGIKDWIIWSNIGVPVSGQD